MRLLYLGLVLLLGLTQSCSESTAPERNALGVTVSYLLRSMIPITHEMTITADGVVQAQRIGTPESTIKAPWRQLSDNEIAELKELLEPFADFGRLYTDPNAMLDGPSTYIAVDRGGVKQEVIVYPSYYDGIPAELAALETRLHALYNEAIGQ